MARMWFRRVALSGIFSILAAAPSAFAQSVDDIVAANLAAKGGQAQLKAIQAIRITGHVKAGPLTIPLTIATERPNKLRQETSIQGQQVIVAFDGVAAWTINPLRGATSPQPIQGPELETLKTLADMDGPLMDYKSKGTTIELLGAEQIGDTKTHKLKITRKDGQSQLLYLDATTGLEVKAVNELTQAGQTMTVESLFSDYRTVGGLTISHTIQQKVNGNEATVTIDKVEVLPDLDDSLFKMPAQ
jgi:outer membrane lipoprotein-sorting protein